MNDGFSRLRILGLPVFSTVDELAALIRISPLRLKILSRYSRRFYKTYTIPKSTGGRRHISQPSRELKAVQAWILRNLLDKLSPSEHATAYVRGKRLSANTDPHSSNRYFLSIDLEDFFPSVHRWRVERIFELLGYSQQAVKALTNLSTYFGGLPQGGVTSPALSNLTVLTLDRRLAGLVARRNVVFTRYADDMTFSTNNRAMLLKILPSISHIIRSEGFSINADKIRLLGPRTQCQITGLIKDTAEPRFGIGRKRKMKMRAIMHNIAAGKFVYGDYPDETSVNGWLNYLKGVDEKGYQQMSRYWENLKAKYSGADTM